MNPQQWSGETKKMKERLELMYGPDVKAEVIEIARQILQSMPRGHELGVAVAGLMLAGVAMNEFGVGGLASLDDASQQRAGETRERNTSGSTATPD